MARPTMLYTAEIPTGTPPSSITTKLELIASATEDSPGYTDEVAVLSVARPKIDRNGLITMPNMRPNDPDGTPGDVIVRPAGTVWRLGVSWPGGGITEVFTVPDLAGEHLVIDHQAVEPADITTVIAASNTSVDDTDLPFTAATIQQALEELALRFTANAPWAMPMGQRHMADTYARLTGVGATCRFLIIGDSRLVLSDWARDVKKFLAGKYNTARSPGTSERISDAWTAGGGGGGTVIADAGGASGYLTRLGAGNSRVRTYTWPTTTVTVGYRTGVGAGTFRVLRNGTPVGTVDCNGADGYGLFTPTPTTLGTYTWTIERLTGTVDVDDALPHAGTTRTTGVEVITCAHSGYDLSEHLALGDIRDAWNAWAPHHIVLASSVNDLGSVTEYLTTTIGLIRTDLGASFPITVIAPEPFGLAGSMTTTWTEATLESLDTAEALNCSWLNFWGVLGNIVTDNDPEDLSTDSLHWVESGNQAAAVAVTIALSGDPLGALTGAFARIMRGIRANTVQVRTETGTDHLDLTATAFGPALAMTAATGKLAAMSPASAYVQPANAGKALIGDAFGLGYPGVAVFKEVAHAQPQVYLAESTIGALLGGSATGGSVLIGPGNSTSPAAGIIWDGTGVQTLGRLRIGTPFNTGWGTPTGTLSRATFDTGTVGLATLARVVAALVTDFKTGGALGS